MIHLFAIAFVTGMLLNHTDCNAATVGSVSAVYGEGYKTGEEDRHTLRFDVTHLTKEYMLYGRMDNASYINNNSSFSSRLIGLYHLSPVGVGISAQLQNATKTSVRSVGVGYSNFNRDNQTFLGVYAQSHSAFGDGTHLFGYHKSAQLHGFLFEGFVDSAVYKDVTVTVAQPSLMYAVTPSLSAGVEYQLYWNKAGVKGLDETIPQAKLKWSF
jgi:hypothetical protein